MEGARVSPVKRHSKKGARYKIPYRETGYTRCRLPTFLYRICGK